MCGLTAPFVSAIFKDEAGQIDFQHALLGTPQRDNTFFHRPNLGSKATLLYTLSEKCVLGAVNPKDGALVWRQDLGEGAANRTAFSGFLRSSNDTSLVISAVGNNLRAWEGSDGRLSWEWQSQGPIRSLTVLDMAGGTKDPILVAELDGVARISSVNIVNGKMKWAITAKA